MESSEKRNLAGQLGDKRDLYNGFGMAMSRAVEFAVTPLIFGLLGWWIDGKLGLRPLFMLVLSLFTLCYMSWRMLYDYNTRMKELEAEASGRKTP